jgi:hypothetical protein
MNDVLMARSQLGAAIRYGKSKRAIKEARQQLNAAKLERAVREALAAGITTEQRAEIAKLLTK